MLVLRHCSFSSFPRMCFLMKQTLEGRSQVCARKDRHEKFTMLNRRSIPTELSIFSATIGTRMSPRWEESRTRVLFSLPQSRSQSVRRCGSHSLNVYLVRRRFDTWSRIIQDWMITAAPLLHHRAADKLNRYSSRWLLPPIMCCSYNFPVDDKLPSGSAAEGQLSSTSLGARSLLESTSSNAGIAVLPASSASLSSR